LFLGASPVRQPRGAYWRSCFGCVAGGKLHDVTEDNKTFHIVVRVKEVLYLRTKYICCTSIGLWVLNFAVVYNCIEAELNVGTPTSVVKSLSFTIGFEADRRVALEAILVTLFLAGLRCPGTSRTSSR
jgi:hypothetical protein